MVFPSCDNPNKCHDPVCCTQGKKYEWPEVVGEEVNKAMNTIQHDRPEVNVVIQTQEFLNDDPKEFCCNRVIIYAKQDVIVNPYPRIG
uniref:Uncharacterized protein n=1 Tax=Chenopodium quinoa TaxID=63459 RepID=A0A803L4X4_CHEQI